MPSSVPVYHYTYGHKLASILSDGELRPTGATQPRHERRTLWYSTDPAFEPTALKPVVRPGSSKPVRLSVAELHAMVGIFRFSGDAGALRLRHWRDVPAMAGIHRCDAEEMARVGISLGADPDCWWATVHAQPLALHRFERWTGSDWVAADLASEVRRIGAAAPLVRSAAGVRWTDVATTSGAGAGPS